MLEEVSCRVRELSTTGDLAQEGDASNFCSAEITATETIEIRCPARKLFFNVVRVNHHGDESSCLWPFVWCHQSKNILLGVSIPALADEIPRRFGHEDGSDDEKGRPEPLDGERDSPRPLVLAVDEALQNTGTDELAGRKAHIRVRGQVRSERQRTQL